MLVRKTMCRTCIYRPTSRMNLEELENQVKDEHGFFVGYRVCHAHDDKSQVCCRGFWEKRGAQSTPTQLADRLGIARFTDSPHAI